MAALSTNVQFSLPTTEAIAVRIEKAATAIITAAVGSNQGFSDGDLAKAVQMATEIVQRAEVAASRLRMEFVAYEEFKRIFSALVKTHDGVPVIPGVTQVFIRAVHEDRAVNFTGRLYNNYDGQYIGWVDKTTQQLGGQWPVGSPIMRFYSTIEARDADNFGPDKITP